ncbi:MAG: hypothetical protein JOY60_09945 [Burkholderiaceae bacterium]|nr:hypothetical protein [Roseateles sp.]MBV8470164.1 hypothetical protein [Burkholderiaceae bacterium]
MHAHFDPSQASALHAAPDHDGRHGRGARVSRLALAGLALGAALGAASVHADEGSPPQPSAHQAAAQGEQLASRTPEPVVRETILEDDSNRIEERSVRGQTQQVKVHPKGSKAPDYEIIMGDASRDLSNSAGSSRGAAGQRVWHLFSF